MGADPACLQPLLSEIVASRVDIIIPIGPPQTRAAHAATTSIPIVTLTCRSTPSKPVWFRAFPHPGGNLTGMFLDFPEFGTSWLGC